MSVVMCAHLIYFTYYIRWIIYFLVMSIFIVYHCDIWKGLKVLLLCIWRELRKWCRIEGQITESKFSLSKRTLWRFFLSFVMKVYRLYTSDNKHALGKIKQIHIIWLQKWDWWRSRRNGGKWYNLICANEMLAGRFSYITKLS